MQWVTWENVGIDRIASAWLITRFVDHHAEFVFFPEDTLPPARDAGETFDIPGARLSHRRGHCTFHTIVQEYGIKDPVLDRMARLIDEADTIQEATLEPAALGVDWVCRGLRKICRDDNEAIQKGFLIFDGLYAYLIEEVGPASTG
ncbi:MAG: chromate resistance protein [Firmicutes bacterium]|nr:chromate resistance protein [Bacillota bacterium]